MGIYWYILIAAIAIVLQAFLYRRYALRKLYYSREFSQSACFAGDDVEMIERLENRKWLPLPWVRLESLIHADLHFKSQFNFNVTSGEKFQNHKSLFSFMPYSRVTRRHFVHCSKRGYYTLDSASMTSGDIVGAVVKHERVALNCVLTVYPKPLPIDQVPMPSHSWQGDFTVRRWIVEDPFLFQGTREYRSGDPMNLINWKATARSQTFQVQQRDFTADPRLMVYLNVDESAEMWNEIKDSDLIENGITYAASVVQFAIDKGIPTGFATNARSIVGPKDEGVRIEADSGKQQLIEIFDQMAKIVLRRAHAFEVFLEHELEQGFTSRDILIITAFVSEKMQSYIEQLEQNGNAVEILKLTAKEDKNRVAS